MRYLLGNLYDFDLTQDAVAPADMPELDRWALMKLEQLIETVRAAYEAYEFHVVFHAIYKFCVLDMSAFYLDVCKDTLYTEKPDSPARRSIQTVLYRIADALTRLLAPILSFTMEEVYQYLPKPADSPASVQLLEMAESDPSLLDPALEEKWEKILAYREVVSGALEKARQDKTIGHSLDAAVEIIPDAEADTILRPLAALLPKLFIVSQVSLLAPHSGEGVQVSVSQAKGQKCSRCWVYSETVGADAAHPELCERCAAALA